MYLTDSDGSDKVLMTIEQFMQIHSERKERNIDPFELVVFQEEQSATLQEYEKQMRMQKQQSEIDTLSSAPSNAYKAFSKNKKPKPRTQRLKAIPDHIL